MNNVANGVGVTIVFGRMGVVIYFADEAKLKQYTDRRRSQRKSPSVEVVTTRLGQIKVPLKTEVTGQIDPSPVGGVSN